jgi:fumarate reductase flavoprotein subunit
MMGGIHTDITTATLIPGLYAAGETACVTINGANRLGSNSLSELLVFGARAGQYAAEYAAEVNTPSYDSLEKMAADEWQRIEQAFFKNEGSERIADIRTDLQKTMEQGADIYREQESLEATCAELPKLKERYARVQVDDSSSVFNTELTAALELGSLLDVAETVAHSALLRRESRGSHSRMDYEERDDENWLCHSLYFSEDQSLRKRAVNFAPTTVEPFEPVKREY